MSIEDRVKRITGDGCIPNQGFSKPMTPESIKSEEERGAIESLPSGWNIFMWRLHKTAIMKGLIPKDIE